MELSYLLTFSFAVVILMLKPGPVMITCISLALEGRWRSIISFWCGYMVVRTGMYFFLLTTLAQLPQGFGIVFMFMKGIASALFITLGINGLQSRFSNEQQEAQKLQNKITRDQLGHNFFMGGFLQVSNPYDYVFILTVIPAIFVGASFTILEITYINLVVIFFDVLINAAYILPILYFRKNFLSDKLLKNLKVISSILLILIGFYIFSTLFFRDGLVSTNLLSG